MVDCCVVTDLRRPMGSTPDMADEKRMLRENIPTDPCVLSKTNCVGPFWSIHVMSERHMSRLRALAPFYTQERLLQTIIPILSVTSDISLRALDWFVINYAKKHHIAIGTSTTVIVNVYSTYRAWLKYWHRSLFDAFRRGTRIYFTLQDKTYSTTPAQLNFLYWAEVSGVLKYAYDHIHTIEEDMNKRIAECKSQKQRVVLAGGKRKRAELALISSTKVSIYTMPTTVSFQ
jgi:hypothetical protein